MANLEKLLKKSAKKIVKQTNNFVKQMVENNSNKVKEDEQKKETKKATVVKYSGDKKTNVKLNMPKSNTTKKINNHSNKDFINGDLNEIENNYLNDYVSKHNYNDENVRVFTKERNQKIADELKANLNDFVQRQSNQNRLAELEVEESNLKKRDESNKVIELLAEDYEKIKENEDNQKQIEAEREAINAGYNVTKKIDDEDLYNAWFVHNYKDNLEKNAEKALHDENVYLNNQNAKVRNAVYDTLTQDTRAQISQAQKAEAEERKADMETQGFDNYQDMVDYNDSWKGTLSYIGRSAYNALTHFNKNITTDVRDFLGIREELNDLGLGFLNDIADYYGDAADNDDEYLASKAKYVGTGTQLAGEGTKIIAQMAPDIAFALLSGGSSATVSAGKAAGNLSTNARVLSSMKTMAKQPAFWTSVIQAGGNAYEEAKLNGATQEEAQLSAIYNGLINATMEMGTGVNNGSQNGITKLLKSGNEDGLEEVAQDFASGLISKGVYDDDKPLFSTTDDNAVFNPNNAVKSYASGFLDGVAGDGIQQGTVNAYNKAKDLYNKNSTNIKSTAKDFTQAVKNKASSVEDVIKNVKENYINNIKANNATTNKKTEALRKNNSLESKNISSSEKNKLNKVKKNSNKIKNLNISNEKTGLANIRKVKSVDNGVVQLLMTNGKVVSADTIDFSGNKNAEIILTNAGKYNSSTANTFIANYDSSRSRAQEYSTAFNSVYKMAKAGVRRETIVSKTRGARLVLGDKSFNAAIRAGRNTAKGVFSDNNKQ